MKNDEYKVLLVDDETDIIEFVGYNLRREGFTVYTAFDGKTALESAHKYKPQLILLDIMMPEMDGIETCEKIRETPALNDIIVCFLTARGEDYSQIAGFEAGADDYIVKPVKPKVLISRINALLKRQKPGANEGPYENNVRSIGDLIIDFEKYTVFKNGNELFLPKKEFELLMLLTSKPGIVYDRDTILEIVWDDNVIVGNRTIDVHIRKLREKLGSGHIRTIKGVGYKYIQ
jgi:two-component system, OmpR family, alkaline phosphatase synthesis response regulator PhoP